MKLHAFMTTPDLVGAEFSGPSWATWRVIARLIDGDAHLLSADEQALALRLTGRTKLPTVAPREVYIGAGRRGGKSRFSALVSAWLVATEYPQLAAGETAVVAHIAPDRKQAGIDLDYTRGLVEGSELLRAELIATTQDTLTFRHRTELQVATASYRTVRGRTLAGATIDESAFLRSEDSALPDIELARALRPALLTLKGLMLVISSPHRKIGLLYEGFKRFFGKDAETRGLYIQAGSRDLNPLLDEAEISEAVRADETAAVSEYLGLFRSDISEYLPDELVDAAIAEGRTSLEPRRGIVYAAFVDMSSGAGADAAALSICHAERDKQGQPRYIQDLALCRWPPFRPDDVAEEFSAQLKRFGLSRVVGDKYAQGWLPAAFERCQIAYDYSEHDRSEIYGEATKLFVERRAEILDDAKLITQLRTLERRPRSGGRQDLIDSPRGAHEDLANATCGALLLVAERELRDPVIDEAAAIEATLRAEPDTRGRTRVLGVVIDGDRLVIAKRIGRLALPPVIATGNSHELGGKIAHEAATWSAFSVYVADLSPGQPVLQILRALKLSVQPIDLFGTAPSETYLDRRTSLAFGLAEWLRHAAVPPMLLQELTAIAFTTRRGVTELVDNPIGACDALALTLLESTEFEFQDPRMVVGNITHAITQDDEDWPQRRAPVTPNLDGMVYDPATRSFRPMSGG